MYWGAAATVARRAGEDERKNFQKVYLNTSWKDVFGISVLEMGMRNACT